MQVKCNEVRHGQQNLILSVSIICFILTRAAMNHSSQERTTSVSHNSLSVCALPIAHFQSLSPCQTQRKHHFSRFQRQKEQMAVLPVSIQSRTSLRGIVFAHHSKSWHHETWKPHTAHIPLSPLSLSSRTKM